MRSVGRSVAVSVVAFLHACVKCSAFPSLYSLEDVHPRILVESPDRGCPSGMMRDPGGVCRAVVGGHDSGTWTTSPGVTGGGGEIQGGTYTSGTEQGSEQYSSSQQYSSSSQQYSSSSQQYSSSRPASQYSSSRPSNSQYIASRPSSSQYNPSGSSSNKPISNRPSSGQNSSRKPSSSQHSTSGIHSRGLYGNSKHSSV